MSWQILPIDRIQEHAGQWDGLAGSGRPVPFLESGFLIPLLAEFGNGRELLALDTDAGRLRAAAIVEHRGRGIWQTFQPSQLPLGAWLSAPGVEVAGVGRTLIGALPGFPLGIGLSQLDPLLQQRPDDDPVTRTLDYIQTAWVDVEGAFDAYWSARGKNLRSNLRKQRAKLEGEGTRLSIECLTLPDQVAPAIADYGQLESAGWKAAGGTAIHPDNAQGRFYTRMLETFCRQGRGRIYRFRFDDKVVAMDLCIEAGDTLVILKTTYDESYKTVSPSSLMRYDQFVRIFDEKRLKRIEFYGKLLEWHTRWTENRRTLYHLTAYRWPLLHAAHRKIQHLRRPAKDSDAIAEA